MEQLLGKMSWSSIVSRTSTQNSYPYTINLSQDSSLYQHNYRQRRKKKDKANEYIETMGKRLTNKASKTQINHNNPKLIIPEKNQLASEPTSDKISTIIQQQNLPNKQTRTQKDPELKRLKIFTEIYNPQKQTTNVIGLQTEIINSLSQENRTITPSLLPQNNQIPKQIKRQTKI